MGWEVRCKVVVCILDDVCFIDVICICNNVVVWVLNGNLKEVFVLVIDK